MPASSPTETIRRMLLAQLGDDGAAFRAAVEEFIAEEKRKSHHVIARDLERLLNGGGEIRRLQPIRSLFAWEADVPKDGDRGLPLLQVREPMAELDRLVLAPETRESLDRFVRENAQGELLRLHGVAPPTRLLLCGPPGCGKTTAAEGVASALRLPFAVVRFDVLVSSYLGETSANLRRIFDFIGQRPMVVLFDEFDGIGKHRGDDLEHGELKRVVNAFLQMLDAFRGESILVAATNHEGLLDPALWRRFDEIAYLDRPAPEARLALLRAALRQVGVDPSVEWDALVRSTDGMAHADIERAAIIAIRATILENKHRVSNQSLRVAVQRCRRMLVLAKGNHPSPAGSAYAPSSVSGGRLTDPPDAVSAERSEPTSPPSPVPGGEGAGVAEAEAAPARKRAEPRNKAAVRPRIREKGGAVDGGHDEEASGTGS